MINAIMCNTVILCRVFYSDFSEIRRFDITSFSHLMTVWTSAGKVTLVSANWTPTWTLFLDPGEPIGFPASEVPLPDLHSDASGEEYRSRQQTHH